jgi:uncharacterized protein (TIGR02646 family)
MIRITKNKGKVPKSLTYPIPIPDTGYTIAKNAAEKREELIAASEYIDNKTYNGYYKNDDTEAALELFYHHTCCYCEQSTEAYHVEHYRPKNLYWWLAYSWDNLLLVCFDCNIAKSNNFEIQNPKVSYLPTDLPNIHSLRDAYNFIENPSLLNPECDDLDGMWCFDNQGEIFSAHHRGKYTIKTCKLNRAYLSDARKKIWDDFCARIKAAEADYLSCYPDDRKRFEETIRNEINFFASDVLNDATTYLAYRRYILDFIADIILEILA